MPEVYVSSVIPAPAGEVWALIRDFNALPAWNPVDARQPHRGGAPADQVGCVREIRLRDGGRIRERLLALSDFDYSCVYSILESPMEVTNYVATLKFTPITDGDATFAEWSAEFDCPPGTRRRPGGPDRRRGLPGRLRRAQDPFRGALMPRVERSAIIDAPDRPGLGAAARLQRPCRLAPGGGRKHARRRPARATQVGAVRRFRLTGGERLARAPAPALRPQPQLQLCHRREPRSRCSTMSPMSN